MKVVADMHINDYLTVETYAKNPNLGPRDEKLGRIWKRRKNKRIYGWRIRRYNPIVYILNSGDVPTVIVSPETYLKILNNDPNILNHIHNLASNLL